MSQPGPKPAPTRLKLLRGNPGKRALNKVEPKPTGLTKVPPAPAQLGDVGKKEWKRMGKELLTMGLLSKCDLPALAGYCASYELWVDAYQNVNLKGSIVKTAGGNIIQNPYLSIANRQMAEMRKWLSEFGCTPSSRSRVQVQEKKGEDPFESFLNRKKG